MKKYIKYLAFFFIIPFMANGCYTVLWTPEDDFPDESNYESYDSYYVEDYHYYYDYPWWLSITPPVKYRTDDEKGYERDNSSTSIRNNGSGRSTDSDREVVNTPPPTKTYSPPVSGTEKSSENSNNNDSNNNSRQGSGSDSNNVRNNDGNRNNGRGR